MLVLKKIALLTTLSAVVALNPFHSPAKAMEEVPLLKGPQTSAIKKLSETLYAVQHPSGQWFCAERLPKVGQRLDFWKQWVLAEYGDGSGGFHGEYKRKWADGFLPKEPGFPQFQSRDQSLNTGLYSFQSMLMGSALIPELWVLFGCQNEIQLVEDITADQIEGAVTLSTDKDAPMSTHMGINRSFQYLLKALEARRKRENLARWGEKEYRECYGDALPKDTDYIVHPGFSLLLHSWGAKLMLMLYPAKLYMITTPAENMRLILIKAFQNKVFIGDNVQIATQAQWKQKNPQSKSVQIRGEIKKLVNFRDELKYLCREMKEWLGQEASFSLKSLDEKVQSEESNKIKHNYHVQSLKACLSEITQESTFTFRELERMANESDARIKDLLEQEKVQESIEIQACADLLPVDHTTSPIRRWEYPEDITQILSPDRTTVLYEYNKTQKQVKVGTLVLKGDETVRFRWFNGGDMVFRTTNPYTTILLSDLAAYFDK